MSDLRAALERYGIHDPSCTNAIYGVGCGCGLFNALALSGSAPQPPTSPDSMTVPTRLLRTEWPLVAGQEPGYPFGDLVASIRAEGIREPLTIKLDWSVIDGAHRLAAARQLGIESVPVRVWTGSEWLPANAQTQPPTSPTATDLWVALGSVKDPENGDHHSLEFARSLAVALAAALAGSRQRRRRTRRPLSAMTSQEPSTGDDR